MMQRDSGASRNSGAQVPNVADLQMAPITVVERVASIHSRFPGLVQVEAAELYQGSLQCDGLVRVGDTILKLSKESSSKAVVSPDGPVWISLKGLAKAFGHHDHLPATTDLWVTSGRRKFLEHATNNFIMVDRNFRARGPIAALCADKEPHALYLVEYTDGDGEDGSFCCKGFQRTPETMSGGRVGFKRVDRDGQPYYKYEPDRTFELDPSCITKVKRVGKTCFIKGPAYDAGGEAPRSAEVIDLKNGRATNLFGYFARFQPIEVAHRFNKAATEEPLYCAMQFLGFGPVVDADGKTTQEDYVIGLVEYAATRGAPASWAVALVPWGRVLNVHGVEGTPENGASTLYEKGYPAP